MIYADSKITTDIIQDKRKALLDNRIILENNFGAYLLKIINLIC